MGKKERDAITHNHTALALVLALAHQYTRLPPLLQQSSERTNPAYKAQRPYLVRSQKGCIATTLLLTFRITKHSAVQHTTPSRMLAS